MTRQNVASTVAATKDPTARETDVDVREHMHLRPTCPFYHGRKEKPFPEQEAGASRAQETPAA